MKNKPPNEAGINLSNVYEAAGPMNVLHIPAKLVKQATGKLDTEKL